MQGESPDVGLLSHFVQQTLGGGGVTEAEGHPVAVLGAGAVELKVNAYSIVRDDRSSKKSANGF